MQDPYSDITFEKKHVKIVNSEGKPIFDEEVEFPNYFDDNSAAIVASRYLCNSAKLKETSLKQMIDRVSDTITNWGVKDGYFTSTEEAEEFRYKLKYYQAHQYFAFNSPVYFNVGLHDIPQTSACFILKIEDNMESIFDIAKIESMIFKNGSGSGINMSPLRSCNESVSGGGFASGPVSFLRAHDTIAGVIKSGGTLRRSAKLVCLNIDHPDIEDFITCKVRDEEKLNILRDNGIKARSGYDLSDEVFYQNTNISVRLNNEFMKAVEEDDYFWTKEVKTGKNFKQYKAKDLLKKIAENAWSHGDPGIMFDDTFNDWNTVANDGKINSTNPCGEFAFIDNSSCNLASINLLKFFKPEINYSQQEIRLMEIEGFKDVIRTMIIAQDILINNSSYPSENIKENSINYRPLGAGYTNLGATLMYLGLPFDSNGARQITSALTALLTGIAYKTSSELALKVGEFKYFENNKTSFYKTLQKHIDAVDDLLSRGTLVNLMGFRKYLEDVWSEISTLITSDKKFRNSTTTLIAPTGTISSLMLAATTGCEPEFALVKYKTLSGSEGASLKYVNSIVEDSLKKLNYGNQEIESMLAYVNDKGNFEGCPILKSDHLPIFDTSIAPKGSKRVIDYMGHVKMIAAIQPFISMGISKTINMPNSCTVDNVYNLFIESWKMGLKGITIYRDGSKTFQVLSTEIEKKNKKVEVEFTGELKRKKLPDDRPAHRHKFRIANVEGYLAPGIYPDTGKLGEIFIDLTKEGSTLSGFADALATVISISLQYGVKSCPLHQ